MQTVQYMGISPDGKLLKEPGRTEEQEEATDEDWHK